jgi:hypothetical protein
LLDLNDLRVFAHVASLMSVSAAVSAEPPDELG